MKVEASYAALNGLIKFPCRAPKNGITMAWRVQGDSFNFQGMKLPIYFAAEGSISEFRLTVIDGRMKVQKLHSEYVKKKVWK